MKELAIAMALHPAHGDVVAVGPHTARYCGPCEGWVDIDHRHYHEVILPDHEDEEPLVVRIAE